jgi:hypothetical protein
MVTFYPDLTQFAIGGGVTHELAQAHEQGVVA